MADLDLIRQNGSVRYVDPQLKGAATGILFFFLLNPGLTFDEPDLEFYTRYSRPTLRAALRGLARFDLVHQLGDRRVWALSAHLRQLDFSEVGLDPVATLRTGILGEREKNFLSPSSSSSSDLDPKDCDLLLLSSPGENFSSPEVAAMLEKAGVFPVLAKKLASDPWVTEDRIDAWLERLRADQTVRSVPALLCTNLKRHLEPGTGPGPVDDWRHGMEQYLCSACQTRPCRCKPND